MHRYRIVSVFLIKDKIHQFASNVVSGIIHGYVDSWQTSPEFIPTRLAIGPDGVTHVTGVGAAAVLVDIETIGFDAVGDDLGAQFPQRGRRDLVGGPVGAVDHDLQPVETAALGERVLNEFDVAAFGIVEPLSAAEIGGLSQIRHHVALEAVSCE